MTAAHKHPPLMTVAEFLALKGDGKGTIYELVEGIVRAQDSASDTHGTIQSNLAFVITAHLRANRPNCRVVTTPGIRPHLHANWNFRVPDLGITCAPNRPGARETPDPILLIEILSPTNASDTWSNIPLYATLPSVMEILIVDSAKVVAEILRRDSNGHWPKEPEPVTAGAMLRLDSIDCTLALSEIYRGTHLAS
jgi:Uma2 family endonuclease